MEPKNIVYLYSEVMPYAISVMRALVQEHGLKVECIHWDENKRTPFVPVNEQGITFYKRSAFDKNTIFKFLEERDPAVIYIAGRMDPLYLETVLHFKKKHKIITACDNQWRGDKKKWFSVFLSYFIYRRYFEYIWVPGKRQYEFARRMGYKKNKIVRNLYTGDSAIYNRAFDENEVIKEEKYPHTIVFVGRFAAVKGLDILLAAFKEAKKELNNDWRLILVGAGDIKIASDPFIEVRGFMSGNELARESRNWGVFCLPSTHEPWGVVIHEFAMAGLPIVCSDQVGAGDDLVVDQVNGLVFRSGQKDDLKRAILEIMNKTDSELLTMGEKGHEFSKNISPSIAADCLMNILK